MSKDNSRKPTKDKSFAMELDLFPKVEASITERKQANPNFSQNDWFNECVHHFLDCRKGESAPAWKFLKDGIKYAELCCHCGKEVRQGTPAYWSKGIGVICITCHDGLEEKGDPILHKKFLKMRYFERLIRELKSESDALAHDVELFQLPQKAADLIEKDKILASKLDEYLRTKIDPQSHNAEEEKILDALIRSHLEVERVLSDINLCMEQQLKKKQREKKVEEIAE